MVKYSGVLITVADIAISRAFYEDLLGQRVKFDFGVDVPFECGLTIHQADHFQGLLGSAADFPITKKANNGELFFEEDDIELLQQRLKTAGVEFIHEVREQPWAQRVMRFYDPDGFIVEVGETMEAVVRRLHAQGLTDTEVSQRCSMPEEFVRQVIQVAG
jgi:catechol 2,3-dioxygenase-like lactoylglutathione lyase family enzyme